MKNIVLLTGGGSGIGASLAGLLALHYELNVIIVGRTLSTLSKTADKSKNIECIVADVTKDEGIKNVVEILNSKQYQVRYLVNNAAILNSSMLANVTADSFLSSLHTNTVAPLLLVNSLLINKILMPMSRILMIDSSSRYNIQDGIGLYGISKAALYRLQQSMRQEFSNQLLVNIVYPGMVNTTCMSDEIKKSTIPALVQARNKLRSILTDNPKMGTLSSMEAAEFLGWILCGTSNDQFLHPLNYIKDNKQLINPEEWDIRDCECYKDCPITCGTKQKELLDSPIKKVV